MNVHTMHKAGTSPQVGGLGSRWRIVRWCGEVCCSPVKVVNCYLVSGRGCCSEHLQHQVSRRMAEEKGSFDLAAAEETTAYRVGGWQWR